MPNEKKDIFEEKIVTIPEVKKDDTYKEARPWYRIREWQVYFIILAVVFAVTITIAVGKIKQVHLILEERKAKAATNIVVKHYEPQEFFDLY